METCTQKPASMKQCLTISGTSQQRHMPCLTAHSLLRCCQACSKQGHRTWQTVSGSEELDWLLLSSTA